MDTPCGSRLEPGWIQAPAWPLWGIRMDAPCGTRLEPGWIQAPAWPLWGIRMDTPCGSRLEPGRIQARTKHPRGLCGTFCTLPILTR